MCVGRATKDAVSAPGSLDQRLWSTREPTCGGSERGKVLAACTITEASAVMRVTCRVVGGGRGKQHTGQCLTDDRRDVSVT